ncbi:unnamed protein product, partial [Prorocentrum cordatum]
GAEPREPPEEAAAGPGLPGGFVELLELARGAHDSQVALLSREVQRLRFELAAARAGVWLPQGRGKPPLEASGGAGPEGAPTAAAGAEGAAQAVCVGPEGDEARKDYQAWRRAEAKADDAQALAGAAPGGSEETGRRTSKKSQFSDSFSPPANRPRWDEELPSAIERLVRHKWFEALVIAMICLNVLMMAVEVEHTGLDLREQARQRTSGAPGVEVWPHAQEVFKGLQWVFGLFFTAEIIEDDLGPAFWLPPRAVELDRFDPCYPLGVQPGSVIHQPSLCETGSPGSSGTPCEADQVYAPSKD